MFEIIQFFSFGLCIGCIMFMFVTIVGIGFTLDNYIHPNWVVSKEKAAIELKKLCIMEVGFAALAILSFAVMMI